MGIITNCGSYSLATKDQIYKVSTVQAKTEDESFRAQIIEEVAIEHQRYCSDGASSKKEFACPNTCSFCFGLHCQAGDS